MRFGFVLLSLVISAGFVGAQDIPFAGPSEGFAFDAPTRSVRPVTGSLGSAIMGQPLVRGLAFGSVAPHQNYALVFQGDLGMIVTGLGSDAQAIADIPGSFGAPDGVTWSSDGSTAVLFSRAQQWVRVFSGFPATVKVGTSLSVSTLGSLTAVAVDAHGAQIALSVAGQVYRVDGGNFVPVLALEKPAALTFSEDGSMLYALDAATNQVFEVNMADLTSLAWPLTGVSDGVAMRTGRDAGGTDVLYVASRADHVLASYKRSTHELLAAVTLNFEPSVVEPLGRNSFLLSARANGDDTMWSFTNASQPAVYFVPALPMERAERRAR